MTQKPKQTKVITQHSDNGDLHEALDEAMFHIREAMEEVKGYGELVDMFSTLSDIHDEMYAMYEECETNLRVEYAEMVREMERDYYRGLM